MFCDIIGNLEEWETVYSAGREFDTIEAARSDGFSWTGGSDDFLIAEIEGEIMTTLTDADGSPLEDWINEDYEPVAAAINLRWIGGDAS